MTRRCMEDVLDTQPTPMTFGKSHPAFTGLTEVICKIGLMEKGC